MKRDFRATLVMVVAVLLTSAAPAVADDRMRVFPDQRCWFALPGADWSWAEKTDRDTLFTAVGPRGLFVTCSALKVAGTPVLDRQAIEKLDGPLFRPGKHQKRGSTILADAPLPCYVANGTLASGNTTSTRFLFGDGYCYHLTIVGGKNPVEQDPAYARIVAGFTAAPGPLPPDLPDARERSVTDRMTQPFLYLVVGAVILVGGRWIAIRRKRSAAG